MQFANILPRVRSGAGVKISRLRLATEIVVWLAAIWCLGTWALAQALQLSAVPDQGLWSPQRVGAWSETLHMAGPPLLAVLKIERLGLDVPVLEGTDDAILDRGAGHIEDTAAPGADGNSGIAAHRDGFFRPLKDARVGDVIELVTPRGTLRYRIEQTWIVEADDVSVLDPTPGAALTLVTCYPFYFIGSAPQRFIVRAVRIT
jgi:sortase A